MSVVTYAQEPRHPAEARLRAFRESPHWGSAELEQDARQALENLLQERELTAEEFERALDEILVDHEGAAGLWDAFLRRYEQEQRGVAQPAVPAGPDDSRPAHRPDVHEPEDREPQDQEPEGMERDLAEQDDFEWDASPTSPPDLGTVTGSPSPRTDTESTADRFLNLALTWPLSRRVVPADFALGAGRPYELLVDIGALSTASLLAERSPAFPADLLRPSPDGHWLTVSVRSDDFDVPPDHHNLFLPAKGNSWVCHCSPDEPHSCTPQQRGDHLHVPLVAPREPGPARMRLLVAHRGNQLQSASVTFRVSPQEGPGGATSALVDYTLAPGFVGFCDLPARTAHIRVARALDGSIAVDVDGAAKPVSAFWLTESQVAGALGRVRRALMAVHAEERTPGVRSNLLDPDNGKPWDGFRADLERLAALGWDLLLLLAPRRPQREALRSVLGASASIQVCRQEQQDLVFPWALIYDIPVDPDVAWTVCESGLDGDLPDSTRVCPGEASHQLNTLCPYGFWGYRHLIEQPPSRPPGQRLTLLAGGGAGAPDVTIARSLALNPTESSRHMERLRTQFDGRLVDCQGRETLFAALSDTSDCVYFYCHGRNSRADLEAPSTTVLEIGENERITPQALAARATTWTDWSEKAPLVFLNGCHTVDTEPATWLSFVDAFTGLSASGVVGTEISVHQALAGEVAELFWQAVLAGHSVGSALHTARTVLLRKGNLLGLAYTAYCSNALRLRPAPA
ncbi:CHAT domain-containing protein [Streptomyces zaehneri]|uniref:CHAT domain-containing protein n=1 Tax=Streptomyces zaehneri TaxID=3051180 RepID=UPI0028D067D5|nr:CHAT domain-containing protein [Streptomyces sp. DSM 40713]